VEHIRERVIRVVSEIAGSSLDEVKIANSFSRLGGWDSLLHLSTVLALEKEFDVHLDVEDLAAIESVDRAVEVLRRAMNQ
jgi:acyl carrier protein